MQKYLVLMLAQLRLSAVRCYLLPDSCYGGVSYIFSYNQFKMKGSRYVRPLRQHYTKLSLSAAVGS